MKRLICMVLVVVLLGSLAGCQKSGLPQPAFPLEKDVIISALEQTGLPGVISESETTSYSEGHIAHVLRDPTRTYGDSENKILTAGISSALTKGERFLSVVFRSIPGEPVTIPFAWEDWKQQFVFTALLFGGFADEEAVYRAFSKQEVPEDKETFKWEAQFPGGEYCTVRYQLQYSKITHTFPEPIMEDPYYHVNVNIYETKSLYQRFQKEMMEKKKEFDNRPAATPD